MIIISQGRGKFAPLILVTTTLFVFGIAHEILGKEYDGYGLSIGMLIGSATLWMLDRGRKSKPIKRLTDTEPVEIKELSKDTLFWIPIRYWTVPIVLFAIYGFLSEMGVS
ncbi:MAG: hypothetical protein LBQ18_01380 [Campylobacteraceae bacterium]|nr:hypothetical protein [Campylobacteraceae bacterium]